MKKFFAFILIVLYSATSFGMTLHMHYCCGKLDKVSFSSKSSYNCKFYKATINSKSCCDNKDFEIKMKIDQEASSNHFVSFEQQPFVSLHLYTSHLFFLYKVPFNILTSGPPPIVSATPLFIQYSVYRI
jgi:hypothetical protein